MSLGKTPRDGELYGSTRGFCEERLAPTSMYRLLAERGGELFPDESFADLFDDVGRRSVPPRIVATVMVLQRLEGASDREAVDRFAFDLRWKYAAGELRSDYPSFAHTVLVDMRARLRQSARPDRLFETALEMAKKAGLVGRRRVLDSTALYDAVATQDTVTMIRSAIRGLLRNVEVETAGAVRAVLTRDDDYASAGKPSCDWDDAAARDALVDALARDGYAALASLEGRTLSKGEEQAAGLLATVLGQDLETREDGVFAIARRVAHDRVISTVDADARHGHKTASRSFDGYKGHIAVDPDSEIITATEVTAGNAGDASVAEALLHDVLPDDDAKAATPAREASDEPPKDVSAKDDAEAAPMTAREASDEPPVAVFGDASYGTADLVEKVEAAGFEVNLKVQPPSPPKKGMFAQDDFVVDRRANTVTCPRGILVALRLAPDHSRMAEFGTRCADCPMRATCTDAKGGRTIRLHPKYDVLDHARTQQRDPEWRTRYRATRPKVERKIAHLTRRKHGGRRARMRGTLRVAQDFALLAAATNLARLASLGVHCTAPRTTKGD